MNLQKRLGSVHALLFIAPFDSLAIAIKKTLFATQRDSAGVEAERQEWLEWVDTLTADDIDHLVFIDESCAKTNMTPLYGWSKAGSRCYGRAPCSWQRFTMLSSIRINGSTESIIFEKGLDKSIFEYFMREVLGPELNAGDIVIMDNCRAHKIDFSELEAQGIKIKSLPRYSPDLNPIELFWGQVKNKLRKAEARTFTELWYESSMAHLEVTAENARGWFKGCGYCH